MENVADFIRQSRQLHRWSLGQLALRSGVSKATLSRWESGNYLPRIPELNRVLDALKASPSERMKCLSLLDAPRAILAARSEQQTMMALSLGDLLYGLRQRTGKTQAEIARAVEISRTLYSAWERDTSRPDTGQLHAVGFALGASAEEIVVMSTGRLAQTPIEGSREVLLEQYDAVTLWDDNVTKESYSLHQFSLLGHMGRLVRSGKADSADLALIVADFGVAAQAWYSDQNICRAYYSRALALAAQSRKLLHFHMVGALTCLLDPKLNPRPLKERLDAALQWQARFSTNAGKAYFLSFIADGIAVANPDEAIRLSDEYCNLVADDPTEYLWRLRNRANLLRKCGKAAKSVAFIAALTPLSTYCAGLQQLEMAKGLIALGSFVEARIALDNAKRILSQKMYPLMQTMIGELENALLN